jgi:signal transduction histidine kinase
MADSAAQDLQPLLAQRDRQIAAVHKISSALSARTSLDELLQETLRVSMECVDAQAGSIILHDPKEDKLIFRYVVGGGAEQLIGLKLDPDHGLCGRAFRTGETIISEDVTQEKEHAAEVGESVHYATRNMVTVPLRSVEGRPIGVMQVLNRREGMFDEHDCEVLGILSIQAATAIETHRLYEAARLAVVANLLGDISHDIKNMITPVQTCAETLDYMMADMFTSLDAGLDEVQAGAEVRGKIDWATATVRTFYPEATEMFLDGSLAVQERVREIADCVKGIVAKPTFEPCNVNDVILKVVKPLEMVGEKRGVKVVSDGLGEVPLTLADQKQIYNAVYNLINNAIPETPEGGQVAVSTEHVAESPLESPAIAIRVADTGRGIPEHVRVKLFSEDAVSTKPGGTGLGTRIVRNVADAHQGKVTVESQEGIGSTFTIYLPVRGAGEPLTE